MGYAPTEAAARTLGAEAMAVAARTREKATLDQWNLLLSATQVATPDPLFDVLVNRWLLYQTVSSRLFAKAGFYQAGGATGYRDQLQDAMALAWAQPGALRAQIVLCASRQFEAGDVQHLVAHAGRCGGAHAFLGRPAVAALCLRPLSGTHCGPQSAGGTGGVP